MDSLTEPRQNVFYEFIRQLMHIVLAVIEVLEKEVHHSLSLLVINSDQDLGLPFHQHSSVNQFIFALLK